jgi:hypothetical protein|tara:strand:- start:1177 stop:3072 length:1896 start_codon:yes stop_codon:yes gene_type:complete
MPLTKLKFRPGINREVTSYSNEGGWYDCDMIRFRYGVPEKIGGWQQDSSSTFLGTCRALHTYVSLAGDVYTGAGTNLKYYLYLGGAFTDITPLRSTTSAGDVTFARVGVGDATLTVTDTNHGAVANDFVTYSGAASLGGNIIAAVLNQEYQIASVTDASTYTIEAKDTSGNAVLAASGDSGNGGGSTVGKYQINTGLNSTVFGTGWGTSTWGRGTWGSSSTLTVSDTLRLWSHDNFGEDLIFNVRDGGIYYWDTSAKTLGTDRAVTLASLDTDSAIPTIAKQVLVSDRDRHIVAFGCDGETTIGTQDPLLIRFSDAESTTTWNALATNSAGELRVGSGSEIICAVETRQQIIVFTDSSLHAMQFLGPPFTFGISQLSENITIMGPMAAKAVDDTIFWMGQEDFYVFDGRVQKLPCAVRSYIFDDFNVTQNQKVFAALNSTFDEVWWFYPSGDSTEIDKYVIYNYQEKAWSYGSLARTAWLDRGINDYPLATGTDYYLYDHEFGLDDGSTNPPCAISSHIESSQIDIGDGERFAFIRRLIPDVTFGGSTATSPTATFTLKTRNFPGGAYLSSDNSSVTQTEAATSTVVEQFTNQAFVRLRGRSFALRVASSGEQVQWRLGSPRVEVRQDGRQ